MSVDILCLITLTPALRINHHKAEPIRTPATIIIAARKFPFVFPRPNPAKTATNESIVVGFVAVRKTVVI